MHANGRSQPRADLLSDASLSEHAGMRIDPIACGCITRPVNVLITALSVFVAGVIASPLWLGELLALCLASLSAASIAAGGNAFNDYCDRELDRRQKPHRPIPSGRVTPGAALGITALCFLSGFAVAIVLGAGMMLIASWAIILLLFYSWRWKRTPLLGNITVAFVAALTFIYGGAAVGAVTAALWAAGLAFLFHLGREIVKDMEDYIGDAEDSANTFAVRFGLPAAGRLAMAVFLILVIFLPLPYLLGPFNILYFCGVLIGVVPLLVYAAVRLWHVPQPRQLRRLSALLKADMFVGLVALLLGSPGIESLLS